MKDTIAPEDLPPKFTDPKVTAKGEARAQVALSNPTTLWFNTGTLCNITCANCYIDSSPSNDALVYIATAEVEAYLDELAQLGWGVREIGFTGGEPFMNPEMIAMAEAALARGYEVLILTNAMRPMMRPRVQAGLTRLQAAYGDRLTLRISLDHWSQAKHDEERGTGSFDRTIEGMCWLRDAGIRMTVAGRSLWDESPDTSREEYANLYLKHEFAIDAQDPVQTVIFPEMDVTVEVPEITTQCWSILNKSPEEVMCSSSRMVVKRKDEDHPKVLACTLLAYDVNFELGTTLAEADRPVALNHPHCAKFCVLGGASCSA